MTGMQRAAIAALKKCIMFPGSWDKRFIRDMDSKPEDFELSPKQAAMVETLTHRYRRQLAATVNRRDPDAAGSACMQIG